MTGSVSDTSLTPVGTVNLSAEAVEAIAARAAAIVAEKIENANGRKWMSVEDAAAYLGLPLHSLYKATARNEVPCRRYGKRILLRADELDNWLDERREGPWPGASPASGRRRFFPVPPPSACRPRSYG